ncbi:hypothetical protein HAX54_021352 [Datura stramonium]|uniref:Uncharacterized protein n=1 Tax=Datura stramonium TaxID=4076 RepID=A0ABS8S3B5_DATST|nr:hypothetical protein [Datura stramonium]
MVDDDHQSTSLTTAAVNFKFIGTQILENMNPDLHALVRNLFTSHATNQSKGNINATEKQVVRMDNPIPVIKPLMITFNTSAYEVSSQSFELFDEQQGESAQL